MLILSPGRLGEGLLVDLSCHGAFLATDLSLEKGTQIGVDITLPGDLDPRPRTLQAVVTRHTNDAQHSQEAGLGVEFLADTEEDRDYILKVVKATLTFDLLGSRKKTATPKGRETIPFGRPFYRPDSKPDY